MENPRSSGYAFRVALTMAAEEGEDRRRDDFANERLRAPQQSRNVILLHGREQLEAGCECNRGLKARYYTRLPGSATGTTPTCFEKIERAPLNAANGSPIDGLIKREPWFSANLSSRSPTTLYFHPLIPWNASCAFARPFFFFFSFSFELKMELFKI